MGHGASMGGIMSIAAALATAPPCSPSITALHRRERRAYEASLGALEAHRAAERALLVALLAEHPALTCTMIAARYGIPPRSLHNWLAGHGIHPRPARKSCAHPDAAEAVQARKAAG